MIDGIQEINTTEFLMKISNDVAVIKNDMQHLKDETQKSTDSMLERVTKLETEVEELMDRDDKKDAKKYRSVL